jgi:putative peptidoglycan lipid II flippase
MAKDSAEDVQQQEEKALDEVVVVPIDATSPAPPIDGTPIVGLSADADKPGDKREIVRSATLVMLGNLSSSVMGLFRQTAIAATGAAIYGPFQAALSPAQKFNDLLVNGSMQGALIPTFNDYAAPEKREELRRLVFTLVNLVVLIVAITSIFYFLATPWLVNRIFAAGYTAQEKMLTIQFARIIFFSLLALGPFAILQSSLYARKEFGWAAVAPTSYHVGIIIGAIVTSIVGSHFIGDYGIAFGVVVGAIGEILLLLPGLHKQQLRYMFVLDLKHAAFRQILKLYAPIACSYFISTAIATLDQNLATRTPCESFMASLHNCGAHNYPAMQYATTLVQFPVGLVAAALGFAVLPTLAAYMRLGDSERFKETLALGIRLGLMLMIPAAAGLIVLRVPIMDLIFLRGKYTPQDALLGALALQNYAIQLPFVVVDQLVINAFYARKNVIIPAVIVLSISELGYLAVALPLWQTMGMPALPLANTTQIALHAIILLVWLRVVIGPLRLRQAVPAVLKVILATAVMVGVAWGLQVVLGPLHIFSLSHFTGRLLSVVVVGGCATVTYFGLITAFKVEEVALLKGTILAKLGRKS